MPKSSPPLFRRCLTWLIALAAAGALELTILSGTFFNGSPQAGLEAMVNGTAYRPYVYRTLLATFIRGESSLVPPTIHQAITQWCQQVPPLQQLFAGNLLPARLFPEALLFLVLTLGCLFGFALLLRAMAARFYPASENANDLRMVVGTLGVNLFVTHYFYVYDPGTLFFTALCLYLLSLKKWRLFWPVFVLATMNKETTLLFIPLLLSGWSGLKTGRGGAKDESNQLAPATINAAERKREWQHVGTALVLWVVTFGLVRWRYHGNPGPLMEVHVFDQWTTAIFASEARYTLTLLVVLSALCAIGWRDKPEFLRMALLRTFFPMLGIMLFVGVLFEIRAYYDMYLLAFLLALPTVERFFRYILTPGRATSLFSRRLSAS